MNEFKELNNELLRIKKLMTSIKKDVISSLQPFINEHKKQMALFQKQMKPTLTQIDQIAKSFNKILQDVPPDFWKECKCLLDFIDNDVYIILRKYNWTISDNMPFFIPFEIYSELKTFNKKEIDDQKVLDNYFAKRFSENNWKILQELITCWEEQSNLSKKRIQILKDCLKIIRRFGKKTSANVVLPTLIAQIEGVWLDLLKTKGINIDEYTFTKNGAPKKIQLYKQKEETKSIINTEEKCEMLAFEILSDVLFSYEDNMQQDFYFYRHKIMHGRSLEYNDIANVIRAFLLIDFLNSLYDERN